MRTPFLLFGATVLALALPASAASLSVTFVQPERYADAGYSSAFANERDRAEVQREIAQHLQSLAERGLPASATLKIEVLDIDLAGEFEPLRFGNGFDVRVLRDITWPRITLHYTLTDPALPVASADVQLSNMSYLSSINRYGSGDRLRYEKAMLDEWFNKRIIQR